MSHELICSWLGLPAETWPPDHYLLLGLQPGENDPKRIEDRVHERLDAVRCYQMTHPEAATEAMNRVAQAFVCLTEPATKRQYDAALLGTVPTAEHAAAQTETVEDREPFELVYNPADGQLAPPIRRPPPEVPPAALPVYPEAIPIPVAAVAAPVAEPVNPSEAPAQSVAARRGLLTKRQLYHRLVQTRHLLELWDHAGKFLASPTQRLNRTADVNLLLVVLKEIREELRSFPPLLGVAGQPGYLVMALTRLASVPMFQALAPSQRESLSRDWHAGKTWLEAHRQFLRLEAKAMRKRRFLRRLTRSVRTSVVEHPSRILILLGLLALSVAIWRTYVSTWIERGTKPASAKVNSGR